MRRLMIVALSMWVLTASAGDLPESVKADRNDGFRWGDISFSHTVVDGNWQTARKEPADIRRDQDAIVMTRELLYPEAAGRETLTLAAPDADSLRIGVVTEIPPGIQPSLRYLGISVPTGLAEKIILTGSKGEETFVFPERFGKMILGQVGGVAKAELRLKDGSGIVFHPENRTVYLQDNRQFRNSNPKDAESFSIRVWHSGDRFSMKMEDRPVRSVPLDLSAVADRPMRDDVAEDGQGGWTDQGAQNDLRMFKPGDFRFGNIHFRVDRPEVVAVAGKNRTMPVEAREIDLPAGTGAKTLALFHTSAWTPRGKNIGEIEVVYDDTGIQRIPVAGPVDCGNWWNPADQANAKVAWRARNGTTDVGLYASLFPLTGTRPIRLRFHAPDPDVVWLIAGATLLDREMGFAGGAANEAVVMKADDEWTEMAFEHRTVPGSPLDFSFLLNADAPAGKYGRALPHPDGTLRFEKAPGKRLRLAGTNLCETMCAPEKVDAPRLADYLASMGINAVRFHHHDNGMVAKGGAVSTAIDAEVLDRMEFLVAELKKRGIYITFDVYTSRKLLPSDHIPEMAAYPKMGDKALARLTEGGLRNLKEFARNWLTHVNPYTGMDWLEDPAIVFANLVNEDTLTYHWRSNPDLVAFLTGRFDEYCRRRDIDDRRVSAANLHFARFLHEIQKDYLEELSRFMKEELKAGYPLTGCNYGDNAATHLLRDLFPVADTHMYHDHPSFPKTPWALPHAYSQTSVIAKGVFLPAGMIRNRIYGKPFFMTEYNLCAPNKFRAEDGPLMGAYSALQDISGIYRFDFSSTRERFTRGKSMVVFESVNDPVMQLSDRIIAALFLRGDVRPAEEKYAYTIPSDFFAKRRDNGIPGMAALRLIAQVGVRFEGRDGPPLPEYDRIDDPKIRRLVDTYEKTGVAVSATGELRLDTRRNAFIVATPRAETLTLPSGALRGDFLAAEGVDTYQTLAALSLADAPLTESDSILVLQVSDVSQAGVRFGDAERTILEKTSEGKHLLRRARAEVELKTGRPMNIEAYNIMGEKIGVVEGRRQDGVLRFTADNDAFPGGVVAYHLTPILP